MRAVSVECVSVCKLKLWRGEGSVGRYDCSVLSCAWKAPRVLTGSLASTTQSSFPSSSSSYSCRRFNRHRYVSYFVVLYGIHAQFSAVNGRILAFYRYLMYI